MTVLYVPPSFPAQQNANVARDQFGNPMRGATLAPPSHAPPRPDNPDRAQPLNDSDAGSYGGDGGGGAARHGGEGWGAGKGTTYKIGVVDPNSFAPKVEGNLDDYQVHPGVELRANYKSNLPQMPPLRGGICVWELAKQNPFVPGLAPGRARCRSISEFGTLESIKARFWPGP